MALAYMDSGLSLLFTVHGGTKFIFLSMLFITLHSKDAVTNPKLPAGQKLNSNAWELWACRLFSARVVKCCVPLWDELITDVHSCDAVGWQQLLLPRLCMDSEIRCVQEYFVRNVIYSVQEKIKSSHARTCFHLLTKCISDHDVFTDIDHGVQACSFRGIHTRPLFSCLAKNAKISGYFSLLTQHYRLDYKP